MAWLISLPIWVIFWSILLPKESNNKSNIRAYMVLCSLALIFVLGLRSRYTGSADTYFYSLAFNGVKGYSNLHEYLMHTGALEGFFLFSEGGFHVFTWLAAQIFPEAQWFLLLTALIIVCATASFISHNSEDPVISWIVFICLGLMTFAMNGMRQAIAMSICLLSYRYAREKKLFRFLIIVLIAVLFHKSAIIFALVYLLRNMKLNAKSMTFLITGVALFLAFSDRFAFLYDSMTGEDYAGAESFESGGVVTILIYLIAIVGMMLFSKRLKEPQGFFPFSLIVVGFSLYLGRFLSVQIYERISYYFAYFLMLGFPMVLQDMRKEDRDIVRVCFIFAAVVLFAYRISKGAFADFTMCW